MSGKVKKSTNYTTISSYQYLRVFPLVILFHLGLLSISLVPKIEFELPIKNADRTIRLDQFALKKDDLKPKVFTTSPGTKKISSVSKPNNILDLKNLQINNATEFDPNLVTKGQTISDSVSEIRASDLKPNDNKTGITLLEKNTAKEMLLRHRKRLRTPEIQMDQESKLNRINSQIGSSIPGQLSDFNFTIVPNSKLSKEDLNSIEKKFYAFNVRLNDKYGSAVSSQILRGLQIRPQLKNSLIEKHILQAKIVYDKNGEIVLTKIIRSSDYKEVHLTFEDILANFGLPNVPKELLDENEQFTVYFTLVIN